MDIYDLQDGTFRPAHEMWDTLKTRAKLGRNEWHQRASLFTKRVLSPENNLSSVVRGKRNMPLHDIVPMLSAFELPPDIHNHYVREFLKSYLPLELVDFFHAPDTSAETLLLREANVNLSHSLDAVRSDTLNSSLWQNAILESTEERDLCDPNVYSDYALEKAEKMFNLRRDYWVSISIVYAKLSANKNTSALSFLNQYFNLVLPIDWRKKLYKEVSNDVLALLQYDAPSTQMSWQENCLHTRPMRSILSTLFNTWKLQYPECAEKYISSWRALPDKYISRYSAYKRKREINDFICEYFIIQHWATDKHSIEVQHMSFGQFLQNYIDQVYEIHPSPLNPLNPFHDFFNSDILELKLIGELRHFEGFSNINELTFEEFCSFGFPKMKPIPNVLEDMSEIIVAGLLPLEEDALFFPLMKAGYEKEDFIYLVYALQDSTLHHKRVEVIKMSNNHSEYRTLERLILMLPDSAQVKYRRRIKNYLHKVISRFDEPEIFIKLFNALATDIIRENVNTFQKAIDKKKLNLM